MKKVKYQGTQETLRKKYEKVKNKKKKSTIIRVKNDYEK